MKTLNYTLIADGSSDKALLNIIKWSLDDLYSFLPNSGGFADFRNLRKPPKSLREKARFAMMYFPFDVLFVHRDAEKTDLNIIRQRAQEIRMELESDLPGKIVCVVPVKMMETWLLIETEAIKKAAENRNYSKFIDLPPIKRLENENQPKELMHHLLREVSGLKGRNLKKFNPEVAVHLVAEYIQDFSPLRNLKAFQAFETELTMAVGRFLEK